MIVSGVGNVMLTLGIVVLVVVIMLVVNRRVFDYGLVCV